MIRFNYLLFFVLICTVISGCTSATRSAINTLPSPQNPQISKTIAEEQKRSLKRIVSIARFTDETKRGGGLFVEGNGIRLAKQASDILSARLVESEKFILTEKLEADSISTDENSSQNYIRSEYVILGSVSEYGRSTDSEVGIFSRNKIQKAYATVNIRLVDTKTSMTIYSEEATGEAVSEANRVFGVGNRSAYDSSLDDKALSAAISKLISNIIENLLDKPWQAYLLKQQNNNYLITGGEEHGINIGDNFQVILKGEQVKNPQTGQMLDLPGTKVAVVQVIGFAGKGLNAISITKLKSGMINDNLSNYVVREL